MTNEILNMEQLDGIAGGNNPFHDLPKPIEPIQPIIPVPAPIPYPPKPVPNPYENKLDKNIIELIRRKNQQ